MWVNKLKSKLFSKSKKAMPTIENSLNTNENTKEEVPNAK